MRYYSRDEVERIGRAGVRCEDRGASYLCRVLSSFWLYCERDDTAFTPWMRSDGFWESWITLWFSQNVNPGDTFLDVGANVGYYSMWAAAHGCKVIAFEPNPECAARIRWAAADNGFDIEIEEVALSDDQGEAVLWIPTGHSGGASIAGPTSGNGEMVNVPKWPLDDIHRIERGQVVMKIDAEGAEPEIWAGMQEQWSFGNTTVVLEWQKDRYDAESFLNNLYANAEVTMIGHDGKEKAAGSEFLLNTSGIEMLVLRSKK